MSEAHWIGESSVHGDVDLTWCVSCDKEASELYDCVECKEGCCHGCSIDGDDGPICIHCYEMMERYLP